MVIPVFRYSVNKNIILLFIGHDRIYAHLLIYKRSKIVSPIAFLSNKEPNYKVLLWNFLLAFQPLKEK